MLSPEADEFLTEFRKKYKPEDVITQIEDLKKLRVLVIGDAIIDQYHYCSSIGKSPKDNIIVTKYLGEESFAGGVLAASNHIAGFCDEVTLVTCLGKQETHENFIRSHLKRNISPVFFYREDTCTPIKRRFVEPVKLTKLFGVSYLDDYDLPSEVTEEIYDFLKCIMDYDVVLVTDFGHGLMKNTLIYCLGDANFLAVNTQTNTDNAGFNLITKYKRAHYICLDEPEIRLAFQDKHGEIEGLISNLQCDKVAVTHGQYDTIMYDGQFYRIPTFSNGLKDTTGAGDAFFSITTPCIASGFPIDLVGFIGNCVGALKIQTVCNRFPIEPKSLLEFIKELLK